MSDFGEWTPEKQAALIKRKAMHYHGETVRRLFLAACILVLLALAFGGGSTVAQVLPIPDTLTLLGVIALALIAGLIDPFRRWTAYLDVVASAIGLFVFGYRTTLLDTSMSVFWINLALALVFMFALYFSVKTLRGRFLNRKYPPEVKG